MKFIEYPKCGTCKKAKDWLIKHNISFEDIDIKINNPTKDDIMKYHKLANIDIRKMFNTSGLLYKELNLKDKLNEMSLDEKYQLLSTNGMLVKRPIIVLDNIVLFGFNEQSYENILLKGENNGK